MQHWGKLFNARCSNMHINQRILCVLLNTEIVHSYVSYVAGLDQSCLSSTSHRCMIGLSLGKF